MAIYKSYSENALFLFKNFSTPGNYIGYSNDDHGRKLGYTLCKFMSPGAGVLMLGSDHISLEVKMNIIPPANEVQAVYRNCSVCISLSL